jgi:hypothetical protein
MDVKKIKIESWRIGGDIPDGGHDAPPCVQCGKEMIFSYGNDEYFAAPFCNFPDCPNYGLLQTALFPEIDK